MTEVNHIDEWGIHTRCQPQPAKTPRGEKFFCPVCHRYVLPDKTHHFINYGLAFAEAFQRSIAELYAQYFEPPL